MPENEKDDFKSEVEARVRLLLKKPASSLNIGLFLGCGSDVLDAMLESIAKQAILKGDVKAFEVLTKFISEQKISDNDNKGVVLNITYPEKVIPPVQNE